MSWPQILILVVLGYVLRMAQTGAFRLWLPRYTNTLSGCSRRGGRQ